MVAIFADTFTLIVSGGMLLIILAVLALGLWHPKSGAEVLQWRPTRSAEVEAQNDIDDVAGMIAAQNELRRRHGKAERSTEDIEAEVRRHQRELADYADAYWAEQRAARAASGEAMLTVYEKPTCTTCRRLARILTERGIDFDRVDYHVEPLGEPKIRELLRKAGITPRDALRTREEGAKALLAREAGDDEIVAAMAADPVLLERPIVERGDRAVLARPAERVLDLL
ncbi:MAG TPA: ArsC/Spx/MgsR family protein [Solirubrobacteraceae bacterium]|nr:ArsC/Spx/MgsR family protein [Solirubrobacteraceae bacterium]